MKVCRQRTRKWHRDIAPGESRAVAVKPTLTVGEIGRVHDDVAAGEFVLDRWELARGFRGTRALPEL